MPTIDVHSHWFSRLALDEARTGTAIDGLVTERRDGDEWAVHRQGYAYPVAPVFYDVEARLARMDELGVDIAVLSVAPTLFMYQTGADEGADFARRTNDELAGVQAESGGRLQAVATLPMQDPAAAAAELQRAVVELGLHGAQIAPVVDGRGLDDPELVTVLATAEALGVPLVVHPTFVGAKPGLEDFYLTNLVGNPLETCVCAARLIFSGTLDRLASLRLLLLHGGGYLPYQIGRLDHGYAVRPETRAAARPPSAYLDRFTFDTLTHRPSALGFLLDLVGAGCVAYGTDTPFDMAGGAFAEQVAGLDLGDDDAARIASRNAVELFGLDPGPGDR